MPANNEEHGFRTLIADRRSDASHLIAVNRAWRRLGTNKHQTNNQTPAAQSCWVDLNHRPRPYQ